MNGCAALICENQMVNGYSFFLVGFLGGSGAAWGRVGVCIGGLFAGYVLWVTRLCMG